MSSRGTYFLLSVLNYFSFVVWRVPHSHFAGWVKRKHGSLSISCTIISFAQLLSLLPLPPSSWHRPGLHNHGFCHEGFLSWPRCGCCAGHNEGEGRGDELWTTCWRRGAGENPSLPWLDHTGTRVLGWVSVLSLLRAKTACVFHCYHFGISCQL